MNVTEIEFTDYAGREVIIFQHGNGWMADVNGKLYGWAEYATPRGIYEINPETGGPRFTPAVGFSLLVFYTLAMQCMSTLAVVYRETKGWKWPAIQMIYMTAVAYLSALLVYQLFS